MTVKIMDFNNEPLTEPEIKITPEGPKKVGDITYDMRLVCNRALNHIAKDEVLNPETLYNRGKLIQKIKSNDVVDLSPKQIEEIKSLIAKVGFTPLVLYQAFVFLDSSPKEQ